MWMGGPGHGGVGKKNIPGRRGGVFPHGNRTRLLALNKNLAPQRFQQEVSLFRSNAPLGDHAQNGLAFLLEIILGCWLGCRGTGVPIPVRCWLTFLFALVRPLLCSIRWLWRHWRHTMWRGWGGLRALGRGGVLRLRGYHRPVPKFQPANLSLGGRGGGPFFFSNPPRRGAPPPHV